MGSITLLPDSFPHDLMHLLFKTYAHYYASSGLCLETSTILSQLTLATAYIPYLGGDQPQNCQCFRDHPLDINYRYAGHHKFKIQSQVFYLHYRIQWSCLLLSVAFR